MQPDTTDMTCYKDPNSAETAKLGRALRLAPHEIVRAHQSHICMNDICIYMYINTNVINVLRLLSLKLVAADARVRHV
jgi:hypothetical protein